MDQYSKRMRTTERQTECEEKPRTISTSQAFECLKDPLKRWHYDSSGCKCGLASDDSRLSIHLNSQDLKNLLERLTNSYNAPEIASQSSQEKEQISPNVRQDSQNDSDRDDHFLKRKSPGIEIIRKLNRVKENLGELKRHNETLKRHNETVKNESARLKRYIAELKNENADLKN